MRVSSFETTIHFFLNYLHSLLHWHNLDHHQQLFAMRCGTHGTHVFHVVICYPPAFKPSMYTFRLNVVAVHWLAVVVGVNMDINTFFVDVLVLGSMAARTALMDTIYHLAHRPVFASVEIVAGRAAFVSKDDNRRILGYPRMSIVW